MKVKFWGTRGSLPVPGPDTVRYGGNTTCIEVLTDDGERIILDAGSGIRPLGLELARNMPVSCSIFISHTHWDHIHGLPFFAPLFVPGNDITIYGATDPVSMKSIKEIFAEQMAYRHFPVRSTELKSNLQYGALKEGQTIEIGSAKLTAMVMNHTVLTFGSRIEDNGKSLFFSGDHEPFYNIYSPDDKYYDDYEKLIQAKYEALVDFITGVDVLILDSQYTTEEYPLKKGWGHSTFDECVALARQAEVKNVYLTHHEMTRTDEELDRILASLREKNKDVDLNIFIAAEGQEIEI